MPYVSTYGYTGSLAERIAEGILFGTPTIVGEALKPIWDLTTSVFAGTHGGKLASAFGNYGCSGE